MGIALFICLNPRYNKILMKHYRTINNKSYTWETTKL